MIASPTSLALDGDFRVDALDGGSLSFFFERPGRRVKLELAVRPLLVRCPAWSCLIDPGFGPADPRRRERFALRDPIPLEEQCAQLGLAGGPEHVLLTHLHFDHAAGALADQDGTRLRFPRARHYVHALEWRAAVADERGGKLAARIERASGGAPEDVQNLELDGLETELAPGHTEGLVAVWIGRPGGRAMFAADLLPTTRFLEARLDRMADQDPELALRTRSALLERCYRENAYVCFYHDTAKPWTRLAPREAEEASASMRWIAID